MELEILIFSYLKNLKYMISVRSAPFILSMERLILRVQIILRVKSSGMPIGKDLYAKDLIQVLKKQQEANSYKSMVSNY